MNGLKREEGIRANSPSQLSASGSESSCHSRYSSHFAGRFCALTASFSFWWISFSFCHRTNAYLSRSNDECSNSLIFQTGRKPSVPNPAFQLGALLIDVGLCLFIHDVKILSNSSFLGCIIYFYLYNYAENSQIQFSLCYPFFLDLVIRKKYSFLWKICHAIGSFISDGFLLIICRTNGFVL